MTPTAKTVKTTATKPVVKIPHTPTVTKAVATGPITANELATQYQSVGAQLKALQTAKGADAVSDLWARYRMIRIADALATQPKRDDAAAILSKLSAEITVRKK